jgi:DNA processing protein
VQVKKVSLNAHGYPAILSHISGAPKELFVAGEFETLMALPRVAIVGSRRVTPYGKSVTARLAADLARQGIVIISGLALGVDAVAHRAAVEAGGLTLAVLPGPVEQIYPSSHAALAKQIVESGGALASEFPDGTPAFRWNFISRNRIVSALCDALLITEAAEKSGTLHTAKFALEQGKDVLAVPGNITSELSKGTNNLIKSGAAPVTSVDDILLVLHLKPQVIARRIKGETESEQLLIDLLAKEIRDGSELLIKSKLDVGEFNQTLTMLEISGKVRSLGANQWSL